MDEGAGRPAAAVLSAFADPEADPVAAFTALFDFVRPRSVRDRAACAARYESLIELMEAEPQCAAAVRHHLLGILATRRLGGFFADSGILPGTGFFTELGRILADRLLPELPDPQEVRVALRRIFHERGDWVWFSALPAELSRRFWHLIVRDAPSASPMVGLIIDQMLEALLVLAYRIGGTDVEAEFGRLGAEFSGYSACFRGLAGASQRYADALRLHLVDPDAPKVDSAEVSVLVDQCAAVIGRARRLSAVRGTSLRLSYVLQRTTQSLQRVADLAKLLDAAVLTEPGEQRRHDVVECWSAFVRSALASESQRRSLRGHVAGGVSMLAMRVTENAARTGEHYIAETRAAYRSMWRAAMGAGLIIAVMALLKIFAGKVDMAPIGYAVVYSLIYGVGFVVIYMLHLTVATKQPAMTAQTIAGYLGDLRPSGVRRIEDLDRIVDLFAGVARTQTAAILGNVLVALPTALVITVLFVLLAGAPPIDTGKADHLLGDLDIIGWALPHAALAGVFLFLSGVLTGYFDNQASYSRIGERIARLGWLCRVGGPERAARVGGYIESNLGGLSGNFLFGCMLGSAGTIGMILGLPIDIRHIAFSSANLGYALGAYGLSLSWHVVLWSALGVMLIGIVNLAVSFSLALWMAMRARSVRLSSARGLGKRLWERIVLSPASFLSPAGLPRDASGAEDPPTRA